MNDSHWGFRIFITVVFVMTIGTPDIADKIIELMDAQISAMKAVKP